MTEFFFRTEDIKPEEVLDYFVATAQDRRVIEALKGRNPTILVGSRGVGKSFLLRVAQQELLSEFEKSKVLPVYLSFVRSSLLSSEDPQQFQHWMLAKLCGSIIRTLSKAGLLATTPKVLSVLAGEAIKTDFKPTKIELISEMYEDSWKPNSMAIDPSSIPTVDDLKNALEELKDEVGVERFALFFDEAAHVFLPEQQRQFFTLFRDLRSHFITCNAAVYPGVTSYGDSFQPVHDATFLTIDRDVLDGSYLENMREIVEKQADSSTIKAITQNGRNFAVLAYASNGNARSLLKTIARCPKLNSTEVNDTIKQYYRVDIWSEHSNLAERYPGHRKIIDWGRNFIESVVLPDLKQKNDANATLDKNTSAYFWVHRDSPPAVKEALRILAYTGIVAEQGSGMKASRSEIGQRYMVNLGCLFSLESSPASTAQAVAKALTPKRMTEFGQNHSEFKALSDVSLEFAEQTMREQLKDQLGKPIDVLDLSTWNKGKLKELNLHTVRDVLEASEATLKTAYYVGDVRARRMRNAAVAAVLEYLSG